MPWQSRLPPPPDTGLNQPTTSHQKPQPRSQGSSHAQAHHDTCCATTQHSHNPRRARNTVCERCAPRNRDADAACGCRAPECAPQTLFSTPARPAMPNQTRSNLVKPGQSQARLGRTGGAGAWQYLSGGGTEWVQGICRTIRWSGQK